MQIWIMCNDNKVKADMNLFIFIRVALVYLFLIQLEKVWGNGS